MERIRALFIEWRSAGRWRFVARLVGRSRPAAAEPEAAATPPVAEPEPQALAAAELIARADRLSAGSGAAQAFEFRQLAIGKLEEEDRSGAAGPWLHERIARQMYAAARDADRVATVLAEHDDEEAIRWWRQASEQLGSLNLADHDLETEVEFLQQKVIGQAASANHRLGEAANERGDARGAVRFLVQSARLLGYLMQRFKGQPAWVGELHGVALCGAGALSHELAREGALESREAAQDWQAAADLFSQLLEQYPNQPDWVPKLHESALRNGAVGCRNLALEYRESERDRACALWVKSVYLLDQLLERYPDQPAWVPGYRAAALAESAREVLELAESMQPATADDVQRQRALWQQAAAMLGRLIRLDPTQSAWALHHLERARSHAQGR